MKNDRYLKAILTVVAVELGWIGFQLSATPVTAQQPPAVTPVVITGVDINGARGFLPVAILGQARTEARSFLPVDITVRNERIPVSVGQPVDVRATGTVKIEADRPLRVENVGYTPAQRPGE